MSQSGDRGSPGPVVLLILVFGGLLVFPCIIAAVIARRLPRQLAKRREFWFCLAIVGVVSAGGFLLLVHPWMTLSDQLLRLLREIILEFKTEDLSLSRLWSDMSPFWIESLPFAPLSAWVGRTLTPQNARERLLATNEQQVSQLEAASKRAKRRAKHVEIPEQVHQQIVLGLPVGTGFREWISKRLVILPTDELSKHGVVIGTSGSGKSETLLRLAVLAARVLNWQVIYIDGKGDEDAGIRFVAAMKSAGVQRVKLFPAESYNGWIGKWDALLSRLLAVEEFSDTHYRAIAENVLRLALTAPGKPVTSSAELLSRLNLPNEFLLGLYAGYPEQEAYLEYLAKKDPLGTYNRYAALLSKLDGKLDGQWSYDTVDAAYISLDGLALSGTVSGLARYFVEDFAHYAGQRKPKERRVLFIFDDLGAVDANLTNMFERVRSRGVSVYVSGQSDRSIAFRGLLQNAERILSSATTILLHACSRPHEILMRAGTETVIDEASQVERSQETGRSSLRLSEVQKVNPNEVMQLPTGEAYLIAHGKAQRVRILPIPVDPQVLAEVRASIASTNVPLPPVQSTPLVRSTGLADDGTNERQEPHGVPSEVDDEQDEDILQ